ncbi:MAG TPA: pyridoxal-phosphate dependent enzyme [Vicinamibacterales bacterium]|nr:pyridoxal-phosphate dependent enzyme [Vicinamibacterales bacterium]
MRGFVNPAVRRDPEFRGLFSDDDYRNVRAYFGSHPGLAPTPLKPQHSIAHALGIASVDAKDETHRFGVNAFKIAGVRYAVHRLGDTVASLGLVCATAGNHGRAVARVAHEQGVPCTIFVPSGKTSNPLEHATRAARVAAMREDGATVVDVDGSYEQAVRQAAVFGAESGGTVVADTSWDGYEQIPRWIMAGYTQLFEEASAQWNAPPTLVVVQAGVGGLACAAASWFAWRFGQNRPYLVAAEPDTAACLLMSAEAGQAVTIHSSFDTIMAGLRCAEPSGMAWPAIAAGVDAFVTVTDASAIEAMRMLGAAPEGERVDAGPSGACGLAALIELARAPELENVRSHRASGSPHVPAGTPHPARLDRSTRALVIITEGP